MSLKGYEWLRDDKVVMYYTFKYAEIVLLDYVSEKEFLEFNNFLSNHSCKVIKTNCNNYNIKD
ncbi:hypothetical protein IKN40_04500 [bacterium]|nr:hypothetical protein [bacterium]